MPVCSEKEGEAAAALPPVDLRFLVPGAAVTATSATVTTASD